MQRQLTCPPSQLARRVAELEASAQRMARDGKALELETGAQQSAMAMLEQQLRRTEDELLAEREERARLQAQLLEQRACLDGVLMRVRAPAE